MAPLVPFEKGYVTPFLYEILHPPLIGMQDKEVAYTNNYMKCHARLFSEVDNSYYSGLNSGAAIFQDFRLEWKRVVKKS